VHVFVDYCTIMNCYYYCCPSNLQIQFPRKSVPVLVTPPPVGKGAMSVAFVRLSVRPSRKSRTQRPSVPTFETKVPHLRSDAHTSFRVKTSWSLGSLMLTHILRQIFRMRTYRILLVVVVVGVTFGVFLCHFRISLHQTCMQRSNEGPQHCNRAQFSKIAF